MEGKTMAVRCRQPCTRLQLSIFHVLQLMAITHVLSMCPALPKLERKHTNRDSKRSFIHQWRGGASTSLPSHHHGNGPEEAILRVAYQGEPGAYSEKATRELLGKNVVAIGRPSFEDCFRAVASMECDYACLPIENSLGGSIHDNYDLMLRYDLQIVAEHEFRVQHCLLTRPGVQRGDIKYAISHPQALAQCDNFLRSLGITPIATYDTAGSAKMLADGEPLPDRCKPENTAAIASELAGKTYGLHCLEKGVEDDDTNFTRFLLLSRKNVERYLSKKIPAKTSVVFTFPNTSGALFKCLACFSLRDIDFSKIESRPTSASLLNYLKFRSQRNGSGPGNDNELPRFRYCFYLDFLASRLDENTLNALAHLREQADFVRILGSYPQKSRLVGPVKEAVDRIKHLPASQKTSLTTLPSDSEETKSLSIGIIGMDELHGVGPALAKSLLEKQQRVVCTDLKQDRSEAAKTLGVEYAQSFDLQSFLSGLDVVILAVPLMDLDSTALSLPVDALRGKLIVEMGALNAPPKAILLHAWGDYPTIDLMTCHPSDGGGCVYESIRMADHRRCAQLLDTLFRHQHTEMPAADHDETVTDFVTGVAWKLVSAIVPHNDDATTKQRIVSDELLLELYRYSPQARKQLGLLKDQLGELERELVAKDSYLAASAEMKKRDRQELMSETKRLLRDIAREGLGEETMTKPTSIKPREAPKKTTSTTHSKPSKDRKK